MANKNCLPKGDSVTWDLHVQLSLHEWKALYSTGRGKFPGLKKTVFFKQTISFGQFWVLIKSIPPYRLVYFLPRFVLISGVSKIRGKSAEIRL